MNQHESQTSRNVDAEMSLATAWLGALINPTLFFQGLLEASSSWFFTRSWRTLRWYIPALIFLMFAAGLIIYGHSLGPAVLQARYAKLADEEVLRMKEIDEASEKTDKQIKFMSEEKTSKYGEMLYRRLMMLDAKSAKARYMVGLQMARTGHTSRARQLMLEIAPSGGRGYPQAHAWLAIDLYNRPNPSRENLTELMNHLRNAVEWDGAGAGLWGMYAERLSREGNHQEALKALEKAAELDDRLKPKFVLMARSLNLPKLAEEPALDAKKKLQEKIKGPKATAEDAVELVRLLLSEEDFSGALGTARAALNSYANGNEALRFLSSESLRFMYRQSIRKTDKGVELNLQLLDAALKEFPTNPNIATEIALLQGMGVAATPALKAALEEQLANGQSTALAHLVLANEELKANRILQAIPHLEMALKQAPDHPVTLNNLSLSLAMTNKNQIDRAEELIERAIRVDPKNPELFDTQGEIRLIAGRPLDALVSLEFAIGIDNNRVHTRELMVKAYRAAGMEEQAIKQERAIKGIKPTPPRASPD